MTDLLDEQVYPADDLRGANLMRWQIEPAIRLGKQELGLKHYEGRSSVGLMRHLILCLLSMNFVAEQAATLRGKIRR